MSATTASQSVASARAIAAEAESGESRVLVLVAHFGLWSLAAVNRDADGASARSEVGCGALRGGTQ